MDLESIVFNADGLWIDDTAFTLLAETDEYDAHDNKIYKLSWFTEYGETFEYFVTGNAINNANILNAAKGIIEVRDIDGEPITIQILTAMNLEKRKGA